MLLGLLVNAAPIDSPRPYYYPPTTVRHPKNIKRLTDSTAEKLLDHLSTDKLLSVASSTLSAEFGIPVSQLSLTQSFIDPMDSNSFHAYYTRVLDGLPVVNHNAAVHFKAQKIVSISCSIPPGSIQSLSPDPNPPITPKMAAEIATRIFGASPLQLPSSLSVLEYSANSFGYAHILQLRNDSSRFYAQVSVCAYSGKILQVVDYYNKASYKAIPLPKDNPLDGFELIKDPSNAVASPNGWNNIRDQQFKVTRGNNGLVMANGRLAESNDKFEFDSDWSHEMEPTAPQNVQASLVHVFYLMNKFHDILYHFGFTELTGNFQVDNFGKGGKQEDGIIVNNQSDRSADDSEFATPPDGLPGVATFYLFKLTSPHRDAGLDSFIGLHEFTHGLTQRLTGGSRNGQCLQELEPQGLAEGWSDAVAMFLLRSEQDTRNDDFAAGWYSTGSSSPSVGGLRMYPYSTNIETNILRYRNLATLFKPHQIGSVWATVLNEVYWNLVDLLGFGTNWYDSQQRKGNIVMLKILVGGLMLQPCNPTVLQARDAILGAEAQYYDSEYKCTIWKGFAKRGMGTGAVHKDGRFFDDNKIPEECGL